mmetsp:Transcript_60121/g.143275  ORF Transcript_60121/g.143275 Transcript_60121/m.143275 type:complete len:723 (-) Transcript_60121:231-2399(-)
MRSRPALHNYCGVSRSFSPPTILPEEWQRRWLDKRGVSREQWLFFRCFLEDAQMQINLLLELLESLAAAHDWWLDVQADQRWRQAHPWRKWFASSICFSSASSLVPFLYPSWLWDMDTVERRIEVLENLHAELCRCVGLLYEDVYRLLRFRAEDPSGRADVTVQKCKAQMWLRSMLLEEMTHRFRVRAGGFNYDVASASSKWLSSSSMRRPTVLDRRIALRAAEELQEATRVVLKRLSKPSHISRWRATYLSLAAGGVGCGVLLRCSGQNVSTLAHGVLHYAKGILGQFLREWVLEPSHQLAAQLLPSSRQEVMDSWALRQEKDVLTSMLSDFYDLLKVTKTPDVEAKLTSGDISAAVDYYAKNFDEPLKHLLRGHLLASQMIQAQKMKVVMYELCQNIDGMMHDVQLNVAVSSIFPFFTLIYSIYCWLKNSSRRKDRVWVHTCRFSLDELDRLLSEHEHPAPQPASEALSDPGQLGPIFERRGSRADHAACWQGLSTPGAASSSHTPHAGLSLNGSPSAIPPENAQDAESNIESDFGELSGDAAGLSMAGFERQISGSRPIQDPFESSADTFPRQISGRAKAQAVPRSPAMQAVNLTPDGHEDIFTENNQRLRGGILDGDSGWTWQISNPDGFIGEMSSHGGRAEAPSQLLLQPPQWELSGLLISKVCVLWSTCYRGLSVRELRSFTQDMSMLPSPDLSASQKLHVVARMRRSYSCFDRRA